MSLLVKNEGSERVIIPAGTHQARCYGVIDLGTQYSERFGTWARKVMLQFELPLEVMDDGRPLAISAKYTLSLNEKANLRHILESWLGRQITAEEEKNGFALGSMLGAPCLLSVTHSDSNGKVYANVVAVMSVPKGTKVPDQSNPAISYDVENGKDAVFEKLPEWIRKVIEESKEFKDSGEPADAEPIAEELADTNVPFDIPEIPDEPVAPAETYTWLKSTYTREQWLKRLHKAITDEGLLEPSEMDDLGHDDLQAVGIVIIKQYLALAAKAEEAKKKAEKKATA